MKINTITIFLIFSTSSAEALISYEGRYGPKINSTPLTESKLNISSPVYKSQNDTLSLSLGGNHLHLGHSIILDSGKKVPTDLYRIETGAQYSRQLPEKRNWGLKTTIGSSGDRPFKNSNEINYSLNAHYGFPGSENSHWILMVFFSNNSFFGNYIPIPGFSYVYKTATFTGIFGFPITSIQWTPSPPWIFSLSLFGPTMQSEAAYGNIDQLQFLTGFSWNRQSYIPSDRSNDKDRLTVEEKKIAMGMRKSIWISTTGELQLGRAFDRMIYIGNGLSNKDGGSTSAQSGWYLSTSIKAKF